VLFVSSSVLSHYKESLKESLAEKFSKGHKRDLAQTLANGGAGALIVIANSGRTPCVGRLRGRAGDSDADLGDGVGRVEQAARD
jgi:hypothetical protein